MTRSKWWWFIKRVWCAIFGHKKKVKNPRIRAAICLRCGDTTWDKQCERLSGRIVALFLALSLLSGSTSDAGQKLLWVPPAPSPACVISPPVLAAVCLFAQTTAPIPGYGHVDGLIGAVITDKTHSVHLTNEGGGLYALDVNCASGCGGGGGGGTTTVNQGSAGTIAEAWPVVPYAALLGSWGNAWNNATVGAGATSAVVDTQYAPFITVFGTTGSAGTISLQVSSDDVHFYVTDAVTVSGAGDFGFHVILGARWARIMSSTATTITATISGKT